MPLCLRVEETILYTGVTDKTIQLRAKLKPVRIITDVVLTLLIINLYLNLMEDKVNYQRQNVGKPIDVSLLNMSERTCRECGCTEYDCSQCIEATGRPCHWVEQDLCSACTPNKTNFKK